MKACTHGALNLLQLNASTKSPLSKYRSQIAPRTSTSNADAGGVEGEVLRVLEKPLQRVHTIVGSDWKLHDEDSNRE